MCSTCDQGKLSFIKLIQHEFFHSNCKWKWPKYQITVFLFFLFIIHINQNLVLDQKWCFSVVTSPSWKPHFPVFNFFCVCRFYSTALQPINIFYFTEHHRIAHWKPRTEMQILHASDKYRKIGSSIPKKKYQVLMLLKYIKPSLLMLTSTEQMLF